MNAKIRIDSTVMSKKRLDSEPFRPTITYSQDFHYTATLDTYAGVTLQAQQEMLAYIQAEILAGAEVTTHVSVWLDNVTHPPVAAGVVKLPKGSHDFTWSQLDILQDTEGISTALANVLVNLKNKAKY